MTPLKKLKSCCKFKNNLGLTVFSTLSSCEVCHLVSTSSGLPNTLSILPNTAFQVESFSLKHPLKPPELYIRLPCRLQLFPRQARMGHNTYSYASVNPFSVFLPLLSHIISFQFILCTYVGKRTGLECDYRAKPSWELMRMNG